MKNKIILGDNLQLPLDFVTQTQAILAKRGVGKSYTASVEAEEMLKAGQQVVVIDPTGAWWGLKSSADGKHPGFSIVVFGGEHADVPLEETAGEIIATAIVENRFSAILDLSLFRKGQIGRFMPGFLETLYRINREAMHLIVDEADAMAPQRPFGEEARMLGAMEDVVRRGRKRGIGCTLITQRPAVLNKNVLTQCEILCAMRLIHPKDIDAIGDWVAVHGDPGKAKTMIESLPSLPIGTAWFWAPGWGDIFTRVKIRRRETFDSSATPEVGKSAIKPTVLAPVDIRKLGSQIQATVQKVQENDPKQLRRRIADLERQLVSKGKIADPQTVQRAIDQAVRQCETQQQFKIKDLEKTIRQLQGVLTDIQRRATVVITPVPNTEKASTHLQSPTESAFRPRAVPRKEPVFSEGKLRAGAERMLAALVQWHPNGMAEGQMRSHAGMKKSGTFSTYMSDLRSRDLIEARDGMIFATQAGIDYFGGNIPAAPSTTEDVLSVWEPKLREGARRILRILVSVKGEAIALDELAERSGMVRSGTFSTYLSDLRTAKLIITGNSAARANRETLFL
jgi:hypothetical protein